MKSLKTKAQALKDVYLSDKRGAGVYRGRNGVWKVLY